MSEVNELLEEKETLKNQVNKLLEENETLKKQVNNLLEEKKEFKQKLEAELRHLQGCFDELHNSVQGLKSQTLYNFMDYYK